MDDTATGSQFLRHVTDLAAKREIFAHRPIHATSGIRLVEEGQRFTHEFYDKLAVHRLLPSLEETLVIEDIVTGASLRQDVEHLLEHEPVFASLVPEDQQRHVLARIFATLPLSPPLAFKLTVAREERPEVMAHSLKVAYCAVALAHRCGLPHHEIVNAGAAGIFHDIGLLHVDPNLLRSMQPLQESERRYLYAHPLTAYMILERDPIWHPVVSTAVLEHHERIDGSGYPSGLGEDKLGRLGQLLAVAELAATLLSYGGSYAPRDRVEVVLDMNAGKLNREYCQCLLSMLPPPAPSWGKPHPLGPALDVLVGLSVVFLRWQAIAAPAPDSPLARFVAKRMARLAASLADIGVDLEFWSAFNADTDFDARSRAEMEAAAREGVWQVHAIANEVRRRWEHLFPGSETIAAAAQEWLDSVDALRNP